MSTSSSESEERGSRARLKDDQDAFPALHRLRCQNVTCLYHIRSDGVSYQHSPSIFFVHWPEAQPLRRKAPSLAPSLCNPRTSSLKS